MGNLAIPELKTHTFGISLYPFALGLNPYPFTLFCLTEAEPYSLQAPLPSFFQVDLVNRKDWQENEEWNRRSWDTSFPSLLLGAFPEEAVSVTCVTQLPPGSTRLSSMVSALASVSSSCLWPYHLLCAPPALLALRWGWSLKG